MKKYLVIGRMWFQKLYGNTYHSFKIIDLETGETIAINNFEYGYGEMWRHNAYTKLVKMGLVEEKDRNNHPLNKDRFVYEGIDVKREKDLAF